MRWQRRSTDDSEAIRAHESRRRRWLDELCQDVRSARRNLVRYPVVAIVAVLSLGAGIAATAAALTIRDVFFQNPPPLYVDPDRLSRIQVGPPDRPIMPLGSYVPADLFAIWQGAQGRAIAAAAVHEGAGDVRVADRVEPTRIRPVTANLFDVLGVRVEIGRGFSAGTATGAEAILSYRLWQDWFAGRPDAVGATLWIDGEPHTVIGVMPRRFWFSEMNDPVWTRLEPGRFAASARLLVVARRPDGLSADGLAAGLQGSLAEYSRRLPAGEGPLRMRVSAIRGTPVADQLSLILPYILGAAVALTLIIACANVAILMIAQWTRRETETAVRSALGASRVRLIRALLAESLLLASAAGALGIGGTYVVRAIMLRNVPLAETFVDLSIHPGVLIKTIAITLAAGIVAGIGPALIETRRLQIDPLRGIATSDRVRQRWSHALVVLEITFTLVLLVVTSSMVAGFQRARYADLGFALDRFMVVSVQGADDVSIMHLRETIARVPGVESVGAATAAPFAGAGRRVSLRAAATGVAGISGAQISIDPEFFTTLGVPIRAGRALTRQDTPQTRAAVVNESLARQLFGASAPLQRQVWIDRESYDVVGVVADYATNPLETRLITPKIFLPLGGTMAGTGRIRFLIRASGDPAPLVEPVRRDVSRAAVGVNAEAAYTLRQIATVQQQEYLAATAPLFPLIVIGMLLTASGIYDPPWPAFVLPVVIVAGVALLATWIPTRRALRVNPVLLLKAT